MRAFRRLMSLIPGQYPYSVEIFRETAMGTEILRDRARIRGSKGNYTLEMVSLGSKSLPSNASRFGKQFKLYEGEQGRVVPLGLNVDKKEFSGIAPEDIRMYKQEVDKAKNLYPIDQGLLTGKFAIVTVSIVLLICSIPLFYMMYNQMNEMSGVMSRTSEAMVEAARALGGVEGGAAEVPGEVMPSEGAPPGGGSG